MVTKFSPPNFFSAIWLTSWFLCVSSASHRPTYPLTAPSPPSEVLERPYTAGGGGVIPPLDPPSPPLLPFQCLRLTAKILLRRLQFQEDLSFKNFGPPSAGTIGGPREEWGSQPTSPPPSSGPPPPPLQVSPSPPPPPTPHPCSRPLPRTSAPLMKLSPSEPPPPVYWWWSVAACVLLVSPSSVAPAESSGVWAGCPADVCQCRRRAPRPLCPAEVRSLRRSFADGNEALLLGSHKSSRTVPV